MQKGYIYRHRGAWLLRYYDISTTGRVQRAVKLGSLKNFPTKRSVLLEAEKILGPLNAGHVQPESAMTVSEFIENIFLPYAEKELRPSTLKHYKKDLFEKHLKDRLADIRLRDFRTVTGQRLLREISVGRRTLVHIKVFLSAVFKHAKREGILDGLNPMQDVSVPGKPVKFKGVAYTLENVSQMIDEIDDAKEKCKKGNEELYETAGDVIAMLSFTGLRQSELRGVRWTDWNEQNHTLSIERSVWRRVVGPTKTASSENVIPVLPLLTDLLTRRRERIKPNPTAYIFAGKRAGAPLNLHNLEARIIKPVLQKPGIDGEPNVKWAGFHGFRRGLASNLFDLGVNPKVIAAILRNDVTVALEFYIKEAEGESRLALDKLDAKIRKLHENTRVVFGSSTE